jgi:predicted dehydrogenase
MMEEETRMSKPIRVGILGLGRAGIGMHCSELARYKELFTIVAGCDIEADHRAAFAERTGARCYAGITEFLADPDVELVTVATRSTEHVAHTKLALQAGKYVFVEKPIAVTLKGGLELQRLDKKYPRKVFLRHNRRFEAAFQHIREILASGIIGDVFLIKLRRNGYQRRNDWQTIIACGGGQLNNWGPHIIDHGLRFLESPLAELWGDLKKIAAVGDAEDHLKIIMKGENGRVVDLEISGGSAIGEPAYLISGSKGALRCDESEIYLKYINPKQKLKKVRATAATPPVSGAFGNTEKLEWIEETRKVAPATACQMHSIWKHLYDAIRSRKRFPITMEEGLAVVRVCDRVKKGTPFVKRQGG